MTRPHPLFALMAIDAILAAALAPEPPVIQARCDCGQCRKCAAVKRSQALVERDPDWFKRIGAKGGRPRAWRVGDTEITIPGTRRRIPLTRT